MANKAVAVLVMCIVVVAALHFSGAMAAGEEAKFKSCFETCEKECLATGRGDTFCEVKCDEDCSAKEIADKLQITLPQ